MNGYISAKEAAERWDVTVRMVQRMCVDGRITGATRFAGSWAIPENTVKPTRTARVKPGPKSQAENHAE